MSALGNRDDAGVGRQALLIIARVQYGTAYSTVDPSHRDTTVLHPESSLYVAILYQDTIPIDNVIYDVVMLWDTDHTVYL